MPVTATYHGFPLLVGPQNLFKLTTGTQPSYGFFRMRTSDVTSVLTTLSGAPGILILNDGTNNITLYNIYLVKSTTINSQSGNICDIVLADERILWPFTYGTSDWNTYQADRTLGSAEFELDNLNGGSEWSFTAIRDELKTILSIVTLNFLTPTRKPRNIIGMNIPGDAIMRQFLIALQAYITCDLQVTPISYDIHRTGQVEDGSDIALITTYATLLHQSSTITVNPLVQKGLAVKMLAAADPAVAPERLLTYGSASTGNGSGSHYIPSNYAVFGDEENSATLATIGNEVAGEYVTAFANTWRDSKYAGLLPFKLNKAIHEITWQLSQKGCFTQIRSFRPREELTQRDLQDTLFTYQRYLLNTGGGTTSNVRTAKIQAGGVPSDAVGPFTCKLLDSDGLETGDDINVYPRLHLGTNNFDSTDVHPNLSANDNIPIFHDLDSEWYTTFIFEDTIDCKCN
jgi:hypothetical protein